MGRKNGIIDYMYTFEFRIGARSMASLVGERGFERHPKSFGRKKMIFFYISQKALAIYKRWTET